MIRDVDMWISLGFLLDELFFKKDLYFLKGGK